MEEITVHTDLDNLDKVTAFVESALESHNPSMKTQMQLNVAIDELFSNIVHYSKSADATIQVEVQNDPKQVKLTFIDSGVPYNPLIKADPDITLSAEERQIGGLGIFLVKKTMDGMEYQRADNKNQLTIYKNLA